MNEEYDGNPLLPNVPGKVLMSAWSNQIEAELFRQTSKVPC